MMNILIDGVPRYFEPYVNDCFHNSYAAVLKHMGMNPGMILADYLSFMYDNKKDHIGVNYFYRSNTSVEFTEEELNTSLEFAYLPATSRFSPTAAANSEARFKDRVNIEMYTQDDSDIAYTRLKEMIDNGKPVIAAVDLYYMSYHRAYQKEHGLHCVVITGYNEEEGYFDLFDKFKLSSSDFDGRIPISDVNLGRASENPLPLDDRSKRPIRNLWIEIKADKDFKITKDKLIHILDESCKRMSGTKEVLGYKCGLEMLDSFMDDLLQKKEEELDEKRINWYRSYLNSSFKVIARSRKRFMAFVAEIGSILPGQSVSMVSCYLEESSTHWDIAASIVLKMGIKKSLSLTDDLVKHLGEIRKIESLIVEALENCLNKRALFM
jgi:hypothetical protein